MASLAIRHKKKVTGSTRSMRFHHTSTRIHSQIFISIFKMSFQQILPYVVDYMIRESEVRVPYDTEAVTNMVLACSHKHCNSFLLLGDYLATRHIATIELCKRVVMNTTLSTENDPILNCIIPGCRKTPLQYVSMSMYPTASDLEQIKWLLESGALSDMTCASLLEQSLQKMSHTNDLSLLKAREKVNVLLVGYMRDLDQGILSKGLRTGAVLSMFKYMDAYPDKIYYPGILEDSASGFVIIAKLKPPSSSVPRVTWNLFIEVALRILEHVSGTENHTLEPTMQRDMVHDPKFLFDFARLGMDMVYILGQRFIQILEQICLACLLKIPQLTYSSLTILEACVVHHNFDVFRCIAGTLAMYHPHGTTFLQNYVNRATNLSLASFIVVYKGLNHSSKIFFLSTLENLGVSFGVDTYNVFTPLMNACLLPYVDVELIQYLAQLPHAPEQTIHLNGMIMTPMAVLLSNIHMPNWTRRVSVLIDEGCTLLSNNDYYVSLAMGQCIDMWDMEKITFLGTHVTFIHPEEVVRECLYLRAQNVYEHIRGSALEEDLSVICAHLEKMNYPVQKEGKPHPRVMESWSHACLIKM
jgi:hypothetical protein